MKGVDECGIVFQVQAAIVDISRSGKKATAIYLGHDQLSALKRDAPSQLINVTPESDVFFMGLMVHEVNEPSHVNVTGE